MYIEIHTTTVNIGGNMQGNTGLLLLILIFVNFLPTFVALKRKHTNFWPILATNTILGWTGIGWVVALVWSLTHQKKIDT